jgi:hypothetical protein
MLLWGASKVDRLPSIPYEYQHEPTRTSPKYSRSPKSGTRATFLSSHPPHPIPYLQHNRKPINPTAPAAAPSHEPGAIRPAAFFVVPDPLDPIPPVGDGPVIPPGAPVSASTLLGGPLTSVEVAAPVNVQPAPEPEKQPCGSEVWDGSWVVFSHWYTGACAMLEC